MPAFGITRSASEIDLPKRVLADQRRAFLDPVLHQPNPAAREHLDVDRLGNQHDARDLVGQHHLRPDDLVDVGEGVVVAVALKRLVVLLFGDETEGLSTAQALGRHAGDDVFFVGLAAGDELVLSAQADAA